MSEATMSREDEIKARLEKATKGPWWFDYKAYQLRNRDDDIVTEDIISPDDQTFIANAPADIDYLLAENARLRTRCEALEEHIGKTADGVCLHECESHYCPHCNNKIERGDSFTAYCDHCPNPDGGAYPAGPPLPMFWEQTLANTREPAK